MAEDTRKSGRPTKYNPELGQKLIAGIRQGATRRDAAALCGVTYRTLHNWLKAGQEEAGEEEAAGEFFHFFLLFEQAEAELMTLLAQTVVKAALTDPRLALDVLQRRRRVEWGASLDLGKLSTEQLIDLYGTISDNADDT